jgi:hypothetical protein
MPSPSYATLAQRADTAMYTVEVACRCPDCGELVRCVVNGTDVEVPDCADMMDTCYGPSRVEFIQDAARAKAAGVRHEFLEHLREGGR